VPQPSTSAGRARPPHEPCNYELGPPQRANFEKEHQWQKKRKHQARDRATATAVRNVAGRRAAASRRRSWRSTRRRRPQVFPAKEGLQVLRREDRSGQLQRCASAGAVRGGKRQDHAATPDRRVHAASAAFVAGHQAGAEYRTAAVRWTRAVKKKLLAPSF